MLVLTRVLVEMCIENVGTIENAECLRCLTYVVMASNWDDWEGKILLLSNKSGQMNGFARFQCTIF